MIATIKLYEPKLDQLKFKTKYKGLKRFVYVIEYGPFIVYKPSESSANAYLHKHGFVLSDDCSHYIHKYKGEAVEFLEKHYIKR